MIVLSESNYNALVRFRGKSIPISAKETTDEISYFKEMGYIAPDEFGFCEEKNEFFSLAVSYKLTPRGEDALAEFEYRANQEAKNDSAKKKEHIFQILLVFLGAIIGLLIERFSGITDWISSFF
jgi:hypothetical protein